jgi:hypothetical protein
MGLMTNMSCFLDMKYVPTKSDHHQPYPEKRGQ